MAYNYNGTRKVVARQKVDDHNEVVLYYLEGTGGAAEVVLEINSEDHHYVNFYFDDCVDALHFYNKLLRAKKIS
jgi:hypothetical protein